MVKEEWRPTAYPGYSVSSMGRAMGPKGILKCGLDRQGYPRFSLYQNGILLGPRRVHIFVCEAWHGPRPEGFWALHRNDIKTDNRPDNLYWGNRIDNGSDAALNGRMPRGTHHTSCKLTEGQVREIRARYQKGKAPSQQALAREYGVSQRLINLIVRGLAWRHL